ncbi:MAG: hypothetical protein PHI37_02485 [Candidatus Gracilibacteria bacterium]|nr:hypothetical protein [Candidatus Gracilibacteria bacterium]
MKTIKELNEKIWYRAIKVIYIISFLIINSIIIFSITYETNEKIHYENEDIGIEIIDSMYDSFYSFTDESRINNIMDIYYNEFYSNEKLEIENEFKKIIDDKYDGYIEINNNMYNKIIFYIIKGYDVNFIKNNTNLFNISKLGKILLKGDSYIKEIESKFLDKKLNIIEKIYNKKDDIIKLREITLKNKIEYRNNFIVKWIIIGLLIIIFGLIISYLAFFKLINRIFYYIVLGKFNPKE